MVVQSRQSLTLPYQDHFSALIYEPSLKQVVGDALFTKAKLMKIPLLWPCRVIANYRLPMP